ncbi:hypothetical protein [Sphingomonas sp. URHD0057]|uniref:hypothetical protein n=1 Tax=Sphingomonas sp. URHD0057 TaxID=1380389 RepID=UPI00048A987B|nr:hypothetical protein [Sphingomonas sp. URHD0057]
MSVARVYKAASPFNSSELADIDYVQAFDVVYFAHLNHEPTKLIRTDHTAWTFSLVPFGPQVAVPTGVGGAATVPNTDNDNADTGSWAYFPQVRSYVVTAVDIDTGQESRASAAVTLINDLTLKRNYNTITWSAVTGAERYRVYAADNQQDWGWIGDTDELTFTDDYILPDYTDGPPNEYSPFQFGNHPSTVTFFEQRLLWARTPYVPNGIYASRSADFENMDVARPTRADDSIVFRIAAQKVNSVNSLVPLEKLLALTGDGVFLITGSNQEYLSANPPPRAVRQSGRGASRLKPLVVDEVVFYQPSIGTDIRTLGYTFEIDGYRSNDVSIFSPGLFKEFSIGAWSYSQEPLSIIWAPRNDGKLLAFTWQQEQQVWGWTLCETQGKVLDCVTVQEQGESRTYLIVQRVINGVTRTFFERMASAKVKDQLQDCYLDCAISFYIDRATRVFNVPHLAGETVHALADGFVIKDLVVAANGNVDIGYDAMKVVTIGLPFPDVLVETLPLMMQSPSGEIANKKQQTGDIVVQVADTRLGGLEIGRRLTNMYKTKARGAEPIGEPSAVFTGMRTVASEPVVSGETTVFLRHNDPTRFTLTAIYIDPIVTEQ